MLNIQQDVEQDRLLLKLEGDATIETASQLHQALLEGLQNYKDVQIDCSAIESIDLYALQMLCSAHRSSVAWEKSFTYSGILSPAAVSAIATSGLKRDHGCSLCPDGVCCMWAVSCTSSS
ncbi:Anti-anti-sigma regulatory factor (antagonist of anti-sigma factor) [Malonomonas rubra DSM 5091]|uniref:Anti-anti-sigma regulatory factor (Antagonist of anti-sigma factor) n=1 Tax=Malonomonas rubra DSM 5091 TaxID=1122189 RepID=A0A1M6IQY6_MALRU|nr:STAS domain-containing protein [Malonomonas rubra]SHJ36891.1 Anti-anti-sigma regulatory factor (antagonist of anti-sigma factor) [Malonomonas rubra DSM 5091]